MLLAFHAVAMLMLSWFSLSCDVNGVHVLEAALSRVPTILLAEKDIPSDYTARTIEEYQTILEQAMNKKKVSRQRGNAWAG